MDGNTTKLLDEKQAAEMLNIAPQTLALWRMDGRYGFPRSRVSTDAEPQRIRNHLPALRGPQAIASEAAAGRAGGPSPFDLAVVQDQWAGEFKTMVSAATILTPSMNELLAPFARRGPAVIRSEDFGTWLDPAATVAALAELLKPFAADGWEAFRVTVTVTVNRHGWDAPHGLEFIAPAGTP